MSDSDKDLTIKLRLDRSQAKAENERFKGDAKKVEAEVLSDAEAAERAKVNLIRRTNREKVSEAEKALSGVRVAAEREKDAHEAASGAAVGGFSKMGVAAGVAQVGLQKLIDLAGKVGQAFTDAGEKSKKLTAGFADQRDSLGELSTLMGRKADNEFTLDFARFNAKTGFRPEEGKQFLTELYNSGAQYEGKTISKPEFQQYGEQVGQLAVARQIRPDVVGDVAGSVLGFTDYNKFGDQASEVGLGKVNSALATLGRGKGDNAVLARQFSMLSSAALNEDSLKGTFKDSDEVAAVISVAAEKHDAQAAELAKMAGRGLRDFDNPLIKKAEVKQSDSFTEAFGKINAVVTSEVAKRQATTPGFKTEDYLRENLKDEGTIDAWNVFLNKGVAAGGFKDRLDFARQNAGPAPALDLIKESQTGERGMNRQADAQVKLAEAERGAENSQLDIVRKQVLSELIKSRQIDTNATNVKDYMVGTTSFGLLGSGEQVRIDEAVQRKLIERNGGKDDQSWSDYLNVSPTAREDDLRGRMGRIRRRGADPLHDRSGPFAAPDTPALEAGRATPAMEARPGPAPGAPAGPGDVPGAAVVDSKEALGVLKDVRDELRKQNGQVPPPAPPAPMPGAPAVPFR